MFPLKRIKFMENKLDKVFSHDELFQQLKEANEVKAKKKVKEKG